METSKTRAVAIVLAWSACSVSTAHAQTLSDVLTFLVTNQSVQTGSIADKRRRRLKKVKEGPSRLRIAKPPAANLPNSFARRERNGAGI